MHVTKQFNTVSPERFEALRTQVNVGIVASTKTINEEEVDGFTYLTVFFDAPELYTDDALFEIAKKEARTYEVSEIIVEVDGFSLDGDEKSQERLSRAYAMLEDGGIFEGWKDANDVFVDLPKATIKNAVIAAGEKQTELWKKYA